MIKESTIKLLELDDMEWGNYAFSRDPLGHKIPKEEKNEMILLANQCGAEQAKKLIALYGRKDIKEYAKMLGVQVTYADSDGADNYIVFARFNYPNKVTIFSGNVKKIEKLIDENEMRELLGFVDVEAMLLAHELYHFVEEQNETYTKTKKIQLWKLGPIRYKSHLIALSEIAAMSFARELLNLDYNPYLFDGIMLYPHDTKKTHGLINEILTFKNTGL
ncbi:MAG: hypothetical protein K0R15_204 [Clostridiales bacterium]|jgi:hypothetical protein|nr:hypothetical protein [Clostridiales bacterium]